MDMKYFPIEGNGGGGGGYTLPVATSTTLGGVMPSTKTEKMTEPVGVDSAGRLYFQKLDNITSIERLGAYTFRISFDDVPPFVDGDNLVVGACSSFLKNGKLYRNLDLYYDNTASFWVKCKNFEGMALISGMNDGELDYTLLKQLPYRILDGVNTENGIKVSTHLLFNDFGYMGSGNKNFPLYKLPYVILTELTALTSASAIATALSQYLTNIKIPQTLVTNGYLLQFAVTDGTDMYIIAPPTTSTGDYQVIKATAGIERLTNFRYVAKATLQRNDTDLQLRPTGIERWNLINSGATLQDLKFTNAYTSNAWLSEFIGEGTTTKNSTDGELQVYYEIAHSAYERRTRETKETWQTVYSVVYGANGIEELYTQENYDKNYATPKAQDTGVIIYASDTTTVSGWDVPELTVEQVTQAYNALAGGKSLTIVSEDGNLQYRAVLGDISTANPCILLQYYWLGWVDYQVTAQDTVALTAHKIPEAPAHQITAVNVGTDTIDITIS